MSRNYSVIFDHFGLLDVRPEVMHLQVIYQTRHGNKLLAFPSEQNSTGKKKKKEQQHPQLKLSSI